MVQYRGRKEAASKEAASKEVYLGTFGVLLGLWLCGIRFGVPGGPGPLGVGCAGPRGVGCAHPGRHRGLGTGTAVARLSSCLRTLWFLIGSLCSLCSLVLFFVPLVT